MLSELELMNSQPFDRLMEKWSPILDHGNFESIGDGYKRKVTAALLENQELANRQQYLSEAPTNSLGAAGFGYSDNGVPGSRSSAIAGYDPVLISLVRRAMPNLMAYDLAGVQPMSAPTGLIFAMRSKYKDRTSTADNYSEALFQEPSARFAGAGEGATFSGMLSNGGFGASTDVFGDVSASSTVSSKEAIFGPDWRGFTTGHAENLSNSTPLFQEMAFSIERIAVEARTRALKAEYSTELAQDLKAVHGLDAETELANILSTEILAEINREMIRAIYYNAKIGAQQGDLNGAGIYDLSLDSDGRWSAERFRGLMFQIERECNVIAKETRRGKGNFIIVSSDVASALAMGGFLNISPALNVNLDVDDTGSTFAGVLNGRIRVYIDPYIAQDRNIVCVGYKGTSPYDAGLFYCPYVPLQMVRAVGENTFQPKIGFKTRYGMVANPFAESTDIEAEGGNQYYRIFAVKNLHGNT